MSFILRKVEPFPKNEVTDLIASNIKILDEHLELIGKSLGTRSGQWCDLVGIGNEKQLVVIAVEERYTDRMFCNILNRLDSVWENMDSISQLYPSYGIKPNHFPRVVILAPSYPHSFIKSLAYLTYRIRIDLFTYRCLESEKGRGFLVEPVETRVNYGHILKAESRVLKTQALVTGTKITTEEIMEFLH